MFSPCLVVALVVLFPATLVSCHSEFPSSSYGFYIASYLKKKRKSFFGPGGTTAGGTGPVPHPPFKPTGYQPVSGWYRAGSTVTRLRYLTGTGPVLPAHHLPLSPAQPPPHQPTTTPPLPHWARPPTPCSLQLAHAAARRSPAGEQASIEALTRSIDERGRAAVCGLRSGQARVGALTWWAWQRSWRRPTRGRSGGWWLKLGGRRPAGSTGPVPVRYRKRVTVLPARYRPDTGWYPVGSGS
jgi:hypothetical protein